MQNGYDRIATNPVTGEKIVVPGKAGDVSMLVDGQ
jgi:hypothetical protein